MNHKDNAGEHPFPEKDVGVTIFFVCLFIALALWAAVGPILSFDDGYRKGHTNGVNALAEDIGAGQLTVERTDFADGSHHTQIVKVGD